jgi:hypothetical protein
LGLLPGCSAPPYVPGSLLVAPPCRNEQEQATAACNRVVAPNRPLVAFTFGNRCNAPVAVDFARIRATAHDPYAGDEPMTVFDPRSEIHPAVLGARTRGREVIEFDRAEEDRPFVSLCVDVSSLAEGGGAAAPACLAHSDDACKPAP